jgi:competence protein ComEA
MFNLSRGEEATALIAIVAIGTAISVACLSRGDKPKAIEIPLNGQNEVRVQQQRNGPQGRIAVHVSGAVLREGIVELDRGSRVVDALRLAGTTENADLNGVNQAALLVDGEHIVVPEKMSSVGRDVTSSPDSNPGKVNVNVANQALLESLKGIGPVLAGRIIEYRKKRKFEKVDELLQVQGIGPKTLEKIRDSVCVQ